MGHINKEDLSEFKGTINGRKKLAWLVVGIIMDILATICIGLLIIFMNKLPNSIYFHAMLFVLLVIVVLGGELIGVYFGAREQYIYDKQQKKVLNVNE